MNGFQAPCLFAAAFAVIFNVSEDARAQTRQSAPDAAQGVVLVELFTSQGCSSCPAADANLSDLTLLAEQKQLPLYTLSFHVDYWNRLGWTDPYSSAEASRRQRFYAGVFDATRIYTPQMVVNGSVEFVGADRKRTGLVVRSMLQRKPAAAVTGTARIEAGNVAVTWTTAGSQEGDVINVALVQKMVKNAVPAGENSGRTLSHTNIVRGFQTVQAHNNVRKLTIRTPHDFTASDFHIVAYVQSKTDGTIRGANMWPIESD